MYVRRYVWKSVIIIKGRQRRRTLSRIYLDELLVKKRPFGESSHGVEVLPRQGVARTRRPGPVAPCRTPTTGNTLEQDSIALSQSHDSSWFMIVNQQLEKHVGDPQLRTTAPRAVPAGTFSRGWGGVFVDRRPTPTPSGPPHYKFYIF